MQPLHWGKSLQSWATAGCGIIVGLKNMESGTKPVGSINTESEWLKGAISALDNTRNCKNISKSLEVERDMFWSHVETTYWMSLSKEDIHI